MRPRERRQAGEQDLFRSRLDQFDMKHALVKLSRGSTGAPWRSGSGRSTRTGPVARRWRRG